MKKRKTLGSLLGSLALLAVGVATTGRVPGTIDVSDVPLMAFTTSMTDTSAATRLAAEAGSNSAGVYLDRAGHVNVAVTSRTAADKIRRGGGIPHLVTRNAADLARATAALEAGARIPGTGWWADPVTDQVVVFADNTVTGARLEKVEAVVAKLGSAARLTRTRTPYRYLMSGGDEIVADDGGYCSAGFNVQGQSDSSLKFLLTAAHCIKSSTYWTTEKTHERFAGSWMHAWPQHDFGIAKYFADTSVVHYGDVNTYQGSHQNISNAANVVVGQYAARTGATTGFHDGHITATNVTVNYGNGANITGLIQSNICAAGGDSGGPLYSGSTAYGILSGGNGQVCGDPAPNTAYEPVPKALAYFGVRLY
jgi:streptogrisin D